MELIEEDRDTSAAFENLSLEERVMNNSLNNEEESKDLKVSLQMFLQQALRITDMWRDVNRKFDDRRSFPTFLWLLEMSVLDWHKYIANEVLNVHSQRTNRGPWYHNLTCHSNWVTANICYERSLSLMDLLQRIRSQSGNDFSREQAELLASFLNNLIMVQQEQRFIAHRFSEHLEQLRKSSLLSLEAAEQWNLSEDIPSSLGAAAYTKAVEETLELIEAAIQTLTSVRFSSGGSPLENITRWRVLVESSLVNLPLDLICKKHDEAIKLGVSTHSANRLHGRISLLLSAVGTLLLDYVAMHRTVAEVTYMLGDAFTTGGAGMNEVLSCEGSVDALSDLLRENDKVAMEMDFDRDFPWDKHNVLDYTDIDLNDPNTRLLSYPCCVSYDPDDDFDLDT